MRGWKRLVFAGSGSMPVEATSVANALELVGRTPGSVALLDNAPQDPRWRVIPIMVMAGR
jgi:16S rRNA G966 N2-methylase RsmD